MGRVQLVLYLLIPLVSPQLIRDYTSERNFDKNFQQRNNYSQSYYSPQNDYYQRNNYPQQGSYPQQGNYPQENFGSNNYDRNFPSYQQGYGDGYDSNTGYDDKINEVDYGNYYGGDLNQRYKCPMHWTQFRESCYRFMKSPVRPRHEAKKICQAYDSELVSIDTVDEHGFLINHLLKIDPQHRRWYTSVRQQSPQYWVNEDGSQMSNMENAFLPNYNQQFDPTLRRDYLVYRFSDRLRKWGFDMVDGEEHLQFICEAHISKLHFLIGDDRTYTYGIDVDDPEKVPRGPYFIKQPRENIYDLSSEEREVNLTCLAGGYPTPTYEWFGEDYQNDKLVSTKIDPLSDPRYTVSGGSLIIQNPDKNKDRKKYHCKATNKFGSIISESVLLSFGFIREFNMKRSSESGSQNWGKVLSCDEPPHYPKIEYFWARDFFPNLVEEDKRVFVSHDGSLYFSALETIDRGNYSCNVQSDVKTGRNGPFFPLFVNPHSDYQQLKFANNFPKAFPEAPIVGEEVRLECMAFGYPVPSYNWTRKGASIPREAKLSSYSRVLVINKVNVEDEGEYICTISNERSSMNSSVYLNVQAYPNFTIPLLDKHVDNKGDLTWTCEAFGIPDVNYTWWRNGEQLLQETLQPEDKDRYLIQDNVLSIRYLDPERDPGMYQCQAANQLKAVFSSARLRVLSLKPSFKKFPLESETYGAEGGNVTILCNPEAAPRPKFVWKKDNNIIGSGGTRRILENGNLIITHVSRDDAGVYTCTASNQYGIDESKGRLIVIQAPRFIDRLPPRMQTQIQQYVFLHCNAYSNELLDTAYIWLHNGIKLYDTAFDDDFNIYMDRRIKIDGGELSIFNVSLSDTGEYECIVKSAVGKISSKTFLLVEGPPGPPGGLQVINMKKNSATIQWTDGATNGRPILGYIVSGKTNWNSTWVNISNTVQGREIDRYNGRKEGIIENSLYPWSVYEFRIQAYNSLGYGIPSAPSPQHSTPSDKPYRAPYNVSGGGGKIGDLTMKWTRIPSSEQNGPNIHYKVFWRRYEHDTEYQSLLLKEYGNVDMAVVRVSNDFFYTKYEVKVQAINDVGQGPISDPVIVYSAEDMPQVAPQQVAAVSYNSTALNVTWLPIDQTRERIRGKLIGHRLKYWKEINKEEECVYYLSRSTKNWALIVGLQPDTYYYVKVMAFNSAGEGPESERFLERTYRKAPQKPPSSVHVFSVNPSAIRVTWRYVVPTQEEEPLIGFKVRVWEMDQDMVTANDTIIPSGVALEAYVYNLSPGKRYNMRVLAFSNGGDGRMSSPTNIFQMGDYRTASMYRNGSSRNSYSNIALAILFVLGLMFLKDQNSSL